MVQQNFDPVSQRQWMEAAMTPDSKPWTQRILGFFAWCVWTWAGYWCTGLSVVVVWVFLSAEPMTEQTLNLVGTLSFFAGIFVGNVWIRRFVRAIWPSIARVLNTRVRFERGD